MKRGIVESFVLWHDRQPADTFGHCVDIRIRSACI